MSTQYQLRNTFVDVVISKHSSIEMAVRSERSLQRAFARNNTAGSYLPTTIERTDGACLSDEERSRLLAEEDRLSRFARAVCRHA